MNNYNELINKPTINGKELIGEVEVEVSGLPEVTRSDIGKTLMVNNDGEWITENPQSINLSTYEEIAGFFNDNTGGALVRYPIYKKTYKFSVSDESIDVRELNIANLIKFEGFVKAIDGNTYTNIDYYTSNDYHIMLYFDNGYIKLVKGNATVNEYNKGMVTIYYTKTNILGE